MRPTTAIYMFFSSCTVCSRLETRLLLGKSHGNCSLWRARADSRDSALKWFAGARHGRWDALVAPATGREHKGTQIVHALDLESKAWSAALLAKSSELGSKLARPTKLEALGQSHSAVEVRG